nr:hypothetical protein [uncultured bacterium]
MRLLPLCVALGFFLFCCNGSKVRKFQNRLSGDWKIENPTLQSFIRFDERGNVTYFFNSFSYEKDSLAEYGKWKLKEIHVGYSKDTFEIEILKKPTNTIFKIIFDSTDKIKVMDDLGSTFFTRVK